MVVVEERDCCGWALKIVCCFGRAVEFGLMSTTTAKETAFCYSWVRHKRGIVFEIMAGRVDVGASIQFLSQYPGEAEFLTQPLCCLEVSAGGGWGGLSDPA